MAIGRTFKQAFVKAMRSRELDVRAAAARGHRRAAARAGDPVPRPLRAGLRGRAPRAWTRPSCARAPAIDPWFMAELRALARGEDPEAGLVRTFKAVDTCAAEFEAATPYFYSGWERPGPDGPRHEVRARRPRQRGDPGLGPEPDRAGDRVRLLLRARGDDRARVGPRRGDGQLQPGDGLHRLRHLRPAVLRAADARGRARGDRAGAARGRDRAVRRPDAAEARPGPGGRRRAAARARRWSRSTWPRTGRASARCWTSWGSRARPTPPPRRRRRRWRPPRGGLPAAGAALVRARRPGDGDLLLPTRGCGGYLERTARPGRAGGRRSSWTASWRTRSRSTWTRSATARRCGSARSCSTSRRPACTPATRPA